MFLYNKNVFFLALINERQKFQSLIIIKFPLLYNKMHFFSVHLWVPKKFQSLIIIKFSLLYNKMHFFSTHLWVLKNFKVYCNENFHFYVNFFFSLIKFQSKTKSGLILYHQNFSILYRYNQWPFIKDNLRYHRSPFIKGQLTAILLIAARYTE